MINKIVETINNKVLLKEIFRFVLVGSLSTAITYGFYYLFIKWINPTVAFSIAYIIAFVVNFILTTKFTFAVKATTKRGIGFVISNIINYLLSVSLLNLFIFLGLSESVAPIPMFAITIVSNFVIVRNVMIKK